ncbi:MAG: TSUP family transporter [Hyellaceae cyanobacterium CSU_1_1]|nr:TSUP family transporter [Hyellaceae cyanobacterium CSU_1_1]
MMISSFTLVFLFSNKNHNNCSYNIINQNIWQKILFLIIGFVVGIISGLVGSGMEILIFAAMILLFNICEKISSATLIVLMTFNSLVEFLVHKLLIGDFVTPVIDYWLATVPVVVIGAPLGAIICSYLNKEIIVRTLVFLILINLVSSVLFIPLTISVTITGAIVFLAFTILSDFMYRSPRLLI